MLTNVSRVFSALLLLVPWVVSAHQVVWPGNEGGFNPAAPLKLQYPNGSAIIRVQPEIGEPCTVEVNIDPPDSPLLKVEILGDNPAVAVEARVTVLAAPPKGSQTIFLGGEWHATGLPENNHCDAVFPNLFIVSVEVTGSAPPPAVMTVSPGSAQPGAQVTVSGTGLSSVTGVLFGESPAEFIPVDDSTLRVFVPADFTSGTISLRTPAGVVATNTRFVVTPELQVGAPVNGKVEVSWPNRDYPFTLQATHALNSQNWHDVLTTLDHRLALPVEAGPMFYRLRWEMIPTDPTDYNRDRPNVFELYLRDPVAYWATFGLPALARLSMVKKNLATDPYAPFEGFLRGFDANRFITALEEQTLPPPFQTLATNFLANGASVTNAFIDSFVKLVADNDPSTNCPDLFLTNCLSTNVFSPVFAKVITNTFTGTNGWTTWAPDTNKFIGTNTFPRRTDWVDIHGSDRYTTNTPTFLPPNDDTNTTFRVRWENITSPTLWNTTYDAACAAVAVGMSLAKLGVGPTDTTCRFWNEFSKMLGAKPGQLGGYYSSIAELYRNLGYSCDEAYDGNFESAVQEAKKALQRGCDVQIGYVNPNGAGHEEVVLDITIDPNDSSKATVSTLSWGSNATVTYSGSATGGTFSGKSDGAKYRKSTETASFLEGTNPASFRYYCKQ